VLTLRGVDLKVERASVFSKAFNVLTLGSLLRGFDGVPRASLVMGDHGADVRLNLTSGDGFSHHVH